MQAESAQRPLKSQHVLIFVHAMRNVGNVQMARPNVWIINVPHLQQTYVHLPVSSIPTVINVDKDLSVRMASVMIIPLPLFVPTSVQTPIIVEAVGVITHANNSNAKRARGSVLRHVKIQWSVRAVDSTTFVAFVSASKLFWLHYVLSFVSTVHNVTAVVLVVSV